MNPRQLCALIHPVCRNPRLQGSVFCDSHSEPRPPRGELDDAPLSFEPEGSHAYVQRGLPSSVLLRLSYLAALARVVWRVRLAQHRSQEAA